MGRLARVLEYTYRTLRGDKVADVKANPGGGANVTAPHAEPANQTSRPLPQDLTVLVPVPGEGREVVVAFIDPKNLQDIAAGEHKTYARDAAGAQVCSVRMLNTGAISIESTAPVNINGATVGTDGAISSPVSISAPSVVANGKELAGHAHPYTWTDPAGAGNTGPNN